MPTGCCQFAAKSRACSRPEVGQRRARAAGCRAGGRRWRATGRAAPAPADRSSASPLAQRARSASAPPRRLRRRHRPGRDPVGQEPRYRTSATTTVQRLECLGDRHRRRCGRRSPGRTRRCPIRFGWAGIRCGSGRCRGSRTRSSPTTSAPGHVVEPQHHRRAVGAGARRRRPGPARPARSGCGRSARRRRRRRASPVRSRCGGQRRADRRRRPGRRRRRCAAVGVGVGRHAARRCGQIGGQPAPHLRGGHRERGHGRHVGGRGARLDDDAERHVERELGEDLQRRRRSPGCPVSGSTEPSIEFSIGTQAKSAAPSRTAASAAAVLSNGIGCEVGVGVGGSRRRRPSATAPLR